MRIYFLSDKRDREKVGAVAVRLVLREARASRVAKWFINKCVF